MKNKEQWVDIIGYDGAYQVSNLGSVKSFKRKKVHIMSLHDNGYGYLSVGLVINGKLKTICIHKLVSIHFLGHKPDGYNIVIDHIDNDKLNNRADNLQLISHRENCTKDRRNNSKYTGVHKPKGRKKWTSSIHCNGKRHFLGCFDTELDASNAYQAELKKL